MARILMPVIELERGERLRAQAAPADTPDGYPARVMITAGAAALAWFTESDSEEKEQPA